MKRLIFAALAALLAAPLPAAAQDPERGIEIARESERRDAGWGDAQVSLTMVLEDRKGTRRERALRMMMLEVPGERGGDLSISIFDTPADLKGTILLTHTKVGKDDDQWLYLPSLKRVKRISSANKTGAYFGSEFAYEDIATPEIAKFTYAYTGQKPCGRLTCFVVERRPAYRNSGYSVLVTYFDTAEYRPQQVEYFDRRGKLLKVLTFSGYKKFAGRYWRAQTLTMQNRKTGKTTVLKYGNWAFRTGLTAATFQQGNMRNLR